MLSRRFSDGCFLTIRPMPMRCVAWGESFAENNRKYLRFIATDYAIVFINCVLSARFWGMGASYYGVYRVRYTHYVP